MKEERKKTEGRKEGRKEGRRIEGEKKEWGRTGVGTRRGGRNNKK